MSRCDYRTYLKIAALGNTSLKTHEKCSFTTCKLRFFICFCLVSPALTNLQIGSKKMQLGSFSWKN